MFFDSLEKVKADALIKERQIFILYALMSKYVSDGGSERIELERKLLISLDEFINEASRVITKYAPKEEHEIYFKQFNDLIIPSDNLSDISNISHSSLFKFLYSLCSTRSEHSLEIFVKNYPSALNCLTTEEFNLLSIVAATNHLTDFVIHLCNQDKSMDEYAIDKLGTNSLITCIQTPFVAACLGIINGREHTSETVTKAVETL